MEVGQTTALLAAIASLAQAVGWPLLVLFILLYLGKPLKKFLTDVGEFTFKAGASGIEATARRQQIEAAALLGAATASKSMNSEGQANAPDEGRARDIANVVSQAAEPRNRERLAGAALLWVDDRPSNNIYERRALEALGMHCTTSTSTEDALEKLRLNKYDVVISDMGRPPDAQAGYTLLEAKRKLGDTTPFIIYAGSNPPEHRVEARRRGAIGSTNDPQELVELVVGAIQGGKVASSAA